MYIRKGDTVQIIRGKYKGARGRVLEVYTKKQTVLVEGINIMRKHTKPGARNQGGGIVERERPIHISNIMAWDPASNKASEIKMKRLEDGTRVRTWKHSGEALAD